MLAKVLSSAVVGIEAYIVEVEVDITTGFPAFSTVGLPDAAVKESRERVKAAVTNSGLDFPSLKKITVNLAPADIRKEGSAFDLPTAIAILSATGIFQQTSFDDYLMLGELSLDGRVKAVRGALPIASMAARSEVRKLVLPAENAVEAAVVEGVEVYPVKTLPQVVEFLSGNQPIAPQVVALDALFEDQSVYRVDFAEVKGQQHVKRALEVACAGGHNLIMIGPPGSGKSMLAQRMPTILPRMALEEAIETTKIHSVVGLTDGSRSLVATRPFRAPHHTVSDAGLIGGGHIPMPGEVSLAHNGVLFLDELPEFRRNVLEVLRQPMEDGTVTISRAATSITYPARFMLAAAMNPCPCGYSTDPSRECTCTGLEIKRYLSRISGPLMDRIDIHVEAPPIKYRELAEGRAAEHSAAIRERVNRARDRQRVRFAEEGIHSNGQMSTKQLRRYCTISPEGQRLLEQAMTRMGLSARAYDRILKVSRTIADLEGAEEISTTHLAEAIQYRSLDRELP